jgi:hypothetical protein
MSLAAVSSFHPSWAITDFWLLYSSWRGKRHWNHSVKTWHYPNNLCNQVNLTHWIGCHHLHHILWWLAVVSSSAKWALHVVHSGLVQRVDLPLQRKNWEAWSVLLELCNSGVFIGFNLSSGLCAAWTKTAEEVTRDSHIQVMGFGSKLVHFWSRWMAQERRTRWGFQYWECKLFWKVRGYLQ